jgi:hypothetical protein
MHRRVVVSVDEPRVHDGASGIDRPTGFHLAGDVIVRADVRDPIVIHGDRAWRKDPSPRVHGDDVAVSDK